MGYFYAVFAYVWWGATPLFWKFFPHIPVSQLVGHRMLWSCIFLSLWLSFSDKRIFPSLPQLNAKKKLLIFLAALAIGINWYLYVYSVMSGHVLEASFGYFVNPLMSVFIGSAFLKEKLNSWQWVSIGFAVLGVSYVSFHLLAFPYLALSLALSFAIYGLCKKLVGISAIHSTWLETLILIIPGYFLCRSGMANLSALDWLGMMLGGVVTATPLVLFSKASQLIPFGHLGILQYLSPSLKLCLATLLFHEVFDFHYQMAFVFIWIGLGIFSVDLWRKKRI